MKSRLKKKTLSQAVFPYVYITPITLILLTFVVASVAVSIIFSFTKYNILSPAEFNGLYNLKKMLTDQKLHICLLNTLKIMVITVPVQIIFSTVLAAVISARQHTLVGKLSKAVIFIPVLSANAIVGTLWKIILNGRVPAVTGFFALFGLDPGMLLGSSSTAIVTLSLILVWKNLGYYMILALSSLINIPESYYEAAKVDGSGVLYSFFHITLPIMKPTIIMNSFLGIVTSLHTFDIVYTMTGGGPSMSTTTLVMYAYDLTFKGGKAGYAMAVSNVLFLIVVAVMLMQKGFMKRETSEL